LTINEYQQLALRTESRLEGPMSNARIKAYNNGLTELKWADRITQGLMGLSGESGECLDMLKKCLFQGHILDVKHLAKELGDVAWYLAVAANAIGYDLETILQMNVEKLKLRYPEGFDSNMSVHRREDDV